MKRLKYGMVGGGLGAYIGCCHRHGARMDDLCELVAGSFSRSWEKSMCTADAWNLPDMNRIYADYREMAECESKREDGIDFVTIVTPNSSHFEIAKCFMEHGINVMCDKPLTTTVEEAKELQRMAHEKNLLFGLTYTYTGYAVIRQAREMIRAGAIGDIIHVRVAHPEDWVIESISPEPSGELPWRLNPDIAGSSLCTADLGLHAEQMLVQFTGLHVKKVLAMFDTYPRYLPLETNSTVLLDLGNGVKGELWASQIASGIACEPSIYVMGSEGALQWDYSMPEVLKYSKKGQPIQYLEAGRPYMCKESLRITRVDAQHHEGYYEAFGNIYRSYAEVLMAKMDGREAESYTFPTIDDGVMGMRFVEACVESQKNSNIWIEL